MEYGFRSSRATNTSFKRGASNKYKRLKISESLATMRVNGLSDTLSFTTSNGYRSAVITQNFPGKHIYYEATISSDVGDCRVGFATSSAEVNGPIGMDMHGYSFGSRNGYLFHKSKRMRYGERYACNNIVGCLLFNKDKEKRLTFFVNGEKVSEDLPVKPGCYYPAISVYDGCVLNVNLGPYFAFSERISRKYSFM